MTPSELNRLGKRHSILLFSHTRRGTVPKKSNLSVAPARLGIDSQTDLIHGTNVVVNWVACGLAMAQQLSASTMPYENAVRKHFVPETA
jgi:hypothetical protein